MSIQIVSDLHLEFRGNKFSGLITPSAPILGLLGDICVCGTTNDYNIFKDFIKYISKKFEYILFITGNHEYYSDKKATHDDTINGINKKIKSYFKKYDNIFFLNNDSIKIELKGKKYIFIGSTLWSHIPNDIKPRVCKLMNDYSTIRIEENGEIRLFNIDDMTKLHNTAVKYIKKAIKKCKPDETIILLTHHKPIITKDLSDIYTYAYETDLTHNIIKKPVILAAHGHTHEHMNLLINDVRIISNPKGYPGQKTNFNKSLSYNI